jgi:PKD domain-containing protein
MSLRRRLSASTGLLALVASIAFVPTAAYGALGTQLTWFMPSPGSGTNGGRGLAISGSTAYVSSTDEPIYVVDLAAHQTTGTLETKGRVPGGFGALTGDPSGQLWGSEYQNEGFIDKINGAEAVEPVFNGAEFAPEPAIAIDGLSADSDGTFWLKGEGILASSKTIYHVEQNGHVLGYCTVEFDASGIAVEGADMWVASVGGHRIYEFEKKTTEGMCGPVKSEGKEVSFPTGEANSEEVSPEGIAFDHCTFPGHLALWTFGAAFVSGPLVAYEIGPYSGSTTDCPPPPKKEEQKKEETKSTPPSAPKASGPSAPTGGTGTGSGAPLAGGSLLLQAADPADPTGTLFVYIWQFGDGTGLTGHGRINHTYTCAGLYHVTVTDIDGSGARHTTSGELSVGFPRSTTKTYRGLRFGPHVRVSGHKATLWLSWSGKGKHVSARSVDWRLDNQRGRRFAVKTHAVGKVTLGRNHNMTAIAHFSNGHSTTIRACFRA